MRTLSPSDNRSRFFCSIGRRRMRTLAKNWTLTVALPMDPSAAPAPPPSGSRRALPRSFQPLDLAAHPHPVDEPPAQRAVDHLAQLADGVRRLAAVVEVELEGDLAHGATSLARRTAQAPSSRTLANGSLTVGEIVVVEQLPVGRQRLLAAQVLDGHQRPLQRPPAGGGQLVERLGHRVELPADLVDRRRCTCPTAG